MLPGPINNSNRPLPAMPSASRAAAFGSAVSVGLTSHQTSRQDAKAPPLVSQSKDSDSSIILDDKFPEMEEDLVHNSDNGLLYQLEAMAMGTDDTQLPRITPPQLHPDDFPDVDLPSQRMSLDCRRSAAVQLSPQASSAKSSRLTKLSTATLMHKTSSGSFSSSAPKDAQKQPCSSGQGPSSRFQMELGLEARASIDHEDTTSLPDVKGNHLNQGSLVVGKSVCHNTMTKRPIGLAGEARMLTNQMTALYASVASSASERPNRHMSRSSTALPTIVPSSSGNKTDISAEGGLILLGPKMIPGNLDGTVACEVSMSHEDSKSKEISHKWGIPSISPVEGGWDDAPSSEDDLLGTEDGDDDDDDEAVSKEMCWHDVQAVPVTDPITGREVRMGSGLSHALTRSGSKPVQPVA